MTTNHLLDAAHAHVTIPGIIAVSIFAGTAL